MILLLALGLTLSSCISPQLTEEINARRNAVAEAKQRLANVQSIDAPDYEPLKAALQVAEAELAESKAKVIMDRVRNGARYIELGTSIISTPLTLFFPAAGPILSALASVLALLRPKGSTPPVVAAGNGAAGKV